MARSVGFIVVTAILVTFQAASSAPTPLYVVYQRSMGFSAATLTLVFAVFAFALVCSLLVFGRLSDHVGRRPVLAAAIALECLALLTFLTARDVTALLAARVTQGVATGMVLPALGAALVDLAPPGAPGRAVVVNGSVPIAGLAFGALACGALVQYAPDPTHLVWALLLATAGAGLVAVVALPETVARRPGAVASLVPRVGVPRRLRRDVSPLVPILVASWALGGLYLSLGPSVAARVLGITNHLVGGLVVAMLCGTGAAVAVASHRLPAAMVSRGCVALLTAGTVVALGGVLAGSKALAVAGTLLAGVGYGASGLVTFGGLAGLVSREAPDVRGRVFAAAYTVAFVSFGLPAVLAGVAVSLAGLRVTLLGYGGFLVLVGLVAVGLRASRTPVGG